MVLCLVSAYPYYALNSLDARDIGSIYRRGPGHDAEPYEVSEK